jgi:hypothetical protein
MKADLTRNTFDPFKHFTRVLMQQGRVQLDADWNEQAAILLRYLQGLAADVIGPQGGPANNLGFGISPYPPASATAVQNDFRIGLGHYYVDGILCEADSRPIAITVLKNDSTTPTVQVDHWMLDGVPFQNNQYVEVFDDVQLPLAKPGFAPTVVQVTAPDQANVKLILQGVSGLSLSSPTSSPKLRRVITYMTQPDYPVPTDEELVANTTYLIYLDVWERHITYVEDDLIREVALGGPDTATRAKVLWQVKAVAGTGACDSFTPLDLNFWGRLFGPNRGRLKARAKQKASYTDPCIQRPDARYRGPENQLYRVEIHSGGRLDSSGSSDTPTFKWSRENGSVVFPIVKLTPGSGATSVTLENLGRDDRSGLAEGEWVEIEDDTYVLQNRAENLLQVQSIDRTTMTVILIGVPGSNVGQDLTQHPLLRRWDHQAGDPDEGGLTLGSDNAALIQENQWLELENGVQIQFQPPVTNVGGRSPNLANRYRTGDYWLIPARTATGDVEWPTEPGLDPKGKPATVPLAKPPDGVTHHYAPLAVITVDTSGNVIVPPRDCRKPFGPVATLRTTAGGKSIAALGNSSVEISNSAISPFAPLPGLGGTRGKRLAQGGIDSLDKLASATPEQVARALKGTGVAPRHAADFIARAKKLITRGEKG